MGHWMKGEFTPKHPEKCINCIKNMGKITYRSSWELKLMNFLDEHPYIIEWGSECLKIQYYHPFKDRNAFYVPDFAIKFQDSNGKIKQWLVEVKPSKESNLQEARSKHDKEALAVNACKWKAALEFCEKNHLEFKVLTEKDLYSGHHNL